MKNMPILFKSMAFLSMVTCLIGCHKSTNTVSTPMVISTKDPEAHLSKYGIGCYSYEDSANAGPPTYLLSDIGKPGVDQLSPDRIAQAHQVQRYFKSKTLRFVIFDKGESSEEFAIYDATEGPCPDSNVRYRILNVAGWEYYQPGEKQWAPIPFPGEEQTQVPYPWITPSR